MPYLRHGGMNTPSFFYKYNALMEHGDLHVILLCDDWKSRIGVCDDVSKECAPGYNFWYFRFSEPNYAENPHS